MTAGRHTRADRVFLLRQAGSEKRIVVHQAESSARWADLYSDR